MITLHEDKYYSPCDINNILNAELTQKTTTKTNKITYYEDIYAFDIESTSYSFKEEKDIDINIYKHIKGITFKIKQSIYLEFGDFNDVRKSLFGNIFFSKSHGVYIDSFYQELNHLYPYEFPEDITNEFDQLRKIIDVFNMNRPDKDYTIKVGLMYVWQMAINGTVIIGRTWEEFINVCQTIADFNHLEKNKRLIIWVHNLSFEMQFIKELFKWTKVFAISNRKPIYAINDMNIEFRCSYILSGYNLATLANNLLKYSIRKLVGDLDYDLPRHEETPITEQEIKYCINDVLIVSAFIQEEIIRNKSITNIPLTATGYARKYVKRNCLNKYNYHKYHNFISGLRLTPEEYNLLRRAFQGGYTHASIRWINKIIRGVIDSFDFTSSYPYVLISEMYPVSSGRLVNVTSLDALNYYLDKYCCVFDIEFTDLQPKVLNESYIPVYKCTELEGEITNNGRLYGADKCALAITNVDFDIIKQCYTWSGIKVNNFMIYQKGYLPKEIIDSILTLYENKTMLKGVAGKEEEYQHSKALLNAIYGMFCMAIDKDVYTFDNVKGWYKDPCDLNKAINKYNKSKQRFSFYPWALFCTAYARRNLWSGILAFGDDYIYSDTDSIKCVNASDHLDYINRYNTMVKDKLSAMCNHYNFDISRCKPKTVKGIEKIIGVWDWETKGESYTAFKTLGAKRYMYEQYEDIHITIAGVGKKKGSEYLSSFENFTDPFNLFSEGLTFPANATGKLTHYYIDDYIDFTMCDYLGNIKECRALSGVYLEPTEYNLSIDSAYKDFILKMNGELI